MNDRSKVRVLAAALAAVVLAVGVGLAAYNAGVAHGLAQGGHLLAPPVGASYVYVGARPWGFGFLFPLLFIGFWFLVLRGLVWRGGWYGAYRRHRCAGVPPAFEEWHRRAHGQPGGKAPLV